MPSVEEGTGVNRVPCNVPLPVASAGIYSHGDCIMAESGDIGNGTHPVEILVEDCFLGMTKIYLRSELVPRLGDNEDIPELVPR